MPSTSLHKCVHVSMYVLLICARTYPQLLDKSSSSLSSSSAGLAGYAGPRMGVDISATPKVTTTMLNKIPTLAIKRQKSAMAHVSSFDAIQNINEIPNTDHALGLVRAIAVTVPSTKKSLNMAAPKLTMKLKKQKRQDNISATNRNFATGDTQDNSTVSESHTESGGHLKIELFSVHYTHVKYPLIFTLVVIVAGFSKLGFHYAHFLSSKVPESCVLIALGVIFGAFLYGIGVADNLKFFEPHEFFLYLLPPIILEAAFSLHDRTFAENLGSVLLFAVLGTILACFALGLSLWGLYLVGAMEDINCSLVQILVFSSLIVAVDPVAVLAVFQEVGVNSTLYFVVFGESLLNDGVTVVLYNVMQIFNKMESISADQVFMGVAKFFVVVFFGLLIGLVCGLVSSYVTKFTKSVRVVEPLIIFGFAYLSYILSELFEFSGIISIIMCGVLQVHYAFHNITRKSRSAIKYFIKVMATTNEIIIFVFLGLVAVNPEHDWKTGFTLWTVVLCIIYRFIITYAISFSINYFDKGKVRRLKPYEMFMISYGGLRGAVCFSLVVLIDPREIPMKAMFVTTTLFVIGFTVFVQGGTIKYLVHKLRITLAEGDENMSLIEELSNHVIDHTMAGIEEIIGYTHGSHHLKEKLDQFDDRIMKPRLLRCAKSTDMIEISAYYEKLLLKEHFRHLSICGATLPRIKTDIRHLDSEVALEQLRIDAGGTDIESHKRHEKLADERAERQMVENKQHVHNFHRFLSHTIDSVRNRLHLHVHDKNMVYNRKHQVVTQLGRKHRKNKQLSKLRFGTDTFDRQLELASDIRPSSTVQPCGAETLIAGKHASEISFNLSDTVYENDEKTDNSIELNQLNV